MNDELRISFRDSENISFTSSEVENIISKLKPSKPLGPYDISILMLKRKIGPVALKYLTQLLKLYIHQLVISYSWKIAKIIHILKPNKSVTPKKIKPRDISTIIRSKSSRIPKFKGTCCICLSPLWF